MTLPNDPSMSHYIPKIEGPKLMISQLDPIIAIKSPLSTLMSCYYSDLLLFFPFARHQD
jgi:hypothetical protein